MTKQVAPFSKGDEDPKRRELVEQGQALARQQDNINWELGDIALTVATTYGEGTLVDFAERIGFSIFQVRQCRWVSGKFEKGTRVTNLSWSHHRAVAGHKDAKELLNRALSNHWSVAKMLCALPEPDEEEDGELVVVDPCDGAGPEEMEEALRILRSDGSASSRKSFTTVYKSVRRSMASLREVWPHARFSFRERAKYADEIGVWIDELTEVRSVMVGKSFFESEETLEEDDLDDLFDEVV